ncbi:hypothetical protein PYCCODRAFT_651656 [Trametes coccinea BRFM310]|uniref:Secreted protein n=1 Tax=Trametes coccinea (strain BRFM310) TaxID=1353009 RepID=A0A1Y2IJW7_TRAC3|nr:hypothetical protein PYCCODRAFT_651656 [Trametes coccinea BRFM310]
MPALHCCIAWACEALIALTLLGNMVRERRPHPAPARCIQRIRYTVFLGWTRMQLTGAGCGHSARCNPAGVLCVATRSATRRGRMASRLLMPAHRGSRLRMRVRCPSSAGPSMERCPPPTGTEAALRSSFDAPRPSGVAAS